MRVRPMLRWVPAAGGAVALLAAAGCAKVDHRADLDRAAALVGSSSAWTPDWNAPWSSEADDLWDAGAGPLTEDLAVTIALRNNRGIRAELETIAAARADLVQAGLLPNPMLSLAFGVPIAGTDGVTMVGAGVMQQLSALWLRPHREAAADARLREAILSVSDRALALVAETRSSHAEVAAAEAAVGLQRGLVSAWERRLSLVRAVAEAGEASALEVSGAEMELGGARRELLERERALATARRELLAHMGRAAAEAEFAALRSPAADDAGVLPEEGALVRLAAEQRLDVAAALAARDAASAGLREAGLAGLPELSVGAMYEREMDGGKMLGPALDVEIPIFDDGSAARARAAAAARRADLAAQQALQAAIREVRTAYHAYTSAAASAAVARGEVVPAAERALELTSALEGAGEATALDVLEAETAAIAARLGAVEAGLAAERAVIELERALGGRLAGKM